ncbi:DUF192 domain-containing protein [Paracoccus sp. M683]|uniref:DUF192 domain-containing protein n=1 Tax=Paracoccus sp. M683 TaxID=2594268 RepID=UPI001180FB0D|nr:DUF192 domain-containing protein [Paracoccus sp. M683]TRW96856.1 DUF192 domain-containing protein [Paracoccus sp. M683]
MRLGQHFAAIGVATLLVAVASAGSGGAQALGCDPQQAIFQTGQGPLAIAVELADDPQERAQGLMFRRDLPAKTGMLFIYDAPQPASFWMRNTLIPLDIIFMDATGTVRHIHRNARPLDETPIPGAAVGDPDPLRLFVLEIAGGEADRLGIKVGQAMAHPAVPADNAAISCD